MKTSKIHMAQVTDQKMIFKWFQKFARAYFGHKIDTKRSRFLDPNLNKFIFAFQGSIPIGFVRISCKSDLCNTVMWYINDAYVRPGYRSKGILKMLISKCVSDYNCGYILLSYDRVIKHLFYYAALGFIHQIQHPDKTLRYLATQQFIDLLNSNTRAAA